MIPREKGFKGLMAQVNDHLWDIPREQIIPWPEEVATQWHWVKEMSVCLP